jgi:hypothetical protein
MDLQEDLLREIRDKVISQETMKPALEELVTLWKGSKIMIPLLASAAAMIWAVVAWVKDHIK